MHTAHRHPRTASQEERGIRSVRCCPGWRDLPEVRSRATLGTCTRPMARSPSLPLRSGMRRRVNCASPSPLRRYSEFVSYEFWTYEHNNSTTRHRAAHSAPGRGLRAGTRMLTYMRDCGAYNATQGSSVEAPHECKTAAGKRPSKKQ